MSRRLLPPFAMVVFACSLALATGALGGAAEGTIKTAGSKPSPRTPTITSGPTSPTTSTSAEFRFAAKGAVDGYECQLDAQVYEPCASPKSYSGLAVGVHTFHVRSVRNGLTSEAAYYSWTIEPQPASPPDTPTIDSGPPSVTTDTSATFAFSSATTGVTFLCSLDASSFATCASPTTYSGLTAGQHQFEVMARSGGGLESGVASQTWTVEAVQAPAAPLATPTIDSAPSSVTNDTSASFAFSSATTGVTFLCSLDGSSLATCASPRTYSGLTAGQHRFEVEARSDAGLESGLASVDWTVDTSPPTVAILSSQLAGTVTIAVAASDDVAVERVEMRVDGTLKGISTVSPYTFTWDTTQETDGDHTIDVRSYDLAGNQSAPVTLAYRVSNVTSGGGSCAGGVYIPPGTDTVATAVAANPGGTTFCVGAGIYRFTNSVVPKAGSTFVGEPGAVFSGARDITSLFTQSGSAWVASGMTMEGYSDPGWPDPCGNGTTLCLRTNDVFYDNRFLTRVGSLAELSSGKFFFDYDADQIYIADPPSGHRVEVAVAPQSLRSFRTDAIDVTVRGIVVEKFANAGSALEGKDGWVLDSVEVRLNHGCGASAAVLRNSLVHDNGQCGFTGGDRPVLVENSEFYENHRIPIICWHTASVKIMRSQNSAIRNSYAHDEDCLGLWTDWDNIGTLYEGNRVERTGGAGIFHEAGFDAVIRNNVVRDAGFDRTGWIDGSGILVNSSPNVEIYGNTVENSKHGIGATNTDRGTSALYGVREVRNLRVHDNVIEIGPGLGRRAAGVAGRITQPFLEQALYDHNTYRICSQTQFVGPKPAGSTTYGYFGWAEWRAQGEDPNSSMSSNC